MSNFQIESSLSFFALAIAVTFFNRRCPRRLAVVVKTMSELFRKNTNKALSVSAGTCLSFVTFSLQRFHANPFSPSEVRFA